MTIGIYKITNMINGKSYIGQSIHIERRLMEHKSSQSSVISKAIIKYGKDNFAFEIIEKCDISLLNKQEAYYIQLYNSVVPNGYNVLLESEQEDKSHFIWIDSDKVKSIIEDLKNINLSISAIAEKNMVHTRTVYYINKGQSHFSNKENYPIREVMNYDTKYCEICGKEIEGYGTKYCSAECSSISQRKSERPEPILLAKEIVELGFEGTGKKYGVSGNAIKKWCVSYGIPKLKNEVKEWLKNNS